MSRNCFLIAPGFLWRLALLLVSLNFANAAELKLPPYTRVTLPNGIVLLLMEQHEVPIISFNVLISAGSVSDPVGKEGLASLTSELLRRGTTTRNANQIASQLDFIGGVLGFDSGLDYTAGGAEFLSKDLTNGLDLLADVLLNPSFTREEVDKRILQRIDELKSSKDEPQTVITNYFSALLFQDHPYGRPIDGDERSMAAIKRDDIIAFYKSQYLPQNIRISVVGDFSKSKMQQLLADRFGRRARTVEPVHPKIPAATPVKGRKLLLVDKPDATQSFYVLGNVGISRTNSDRVRIQVVNTIFGGRFTSMLNDALRVSSGLTYGAHSQFARYRQPGPFSISSFTQNSSTTQAIDMTLAVLGRLHDKGVTAEQLASAKAYLKGQFPPQIETSDQLAALLNQLDFFGLEETEIDQLFARIDGVTVEDCRRVIEKYFPKNDFVMVVVGKAAEIKKDLTKYAPKVEVREITQVGYK